MSVRLVYSHSNIHMLCAVMPNCVTFLPPLQPHHACVFEHENVHAFLVSVTVFRLI